LVAGESTGKVKSMKNTGWSWVAAFFAIILWGATPAATQIAVTAIDATIVGVLRTILASLILLPVAFMMRLPRPNDKASWEALSVSAFAGFVGYTLLFTIGLKYTSTTHAALILAASPVFTGLIGFAVDRKWPRWLWWLGASIALAGEFLLISYRTSAAGKDTASFEGDLMVLCAAVLASAGYVSGGRLSSKIGAWAATTWAIIMAGLIQIPILALPRNLAQITITNSNISSWLSLIYLVIFTSIIGYAAWYWAIGKAGVARISPIQFTQPIISLVIAAILFNEPFTYPVVIAVVTILSGVLITRISHTAKTHQ